MNAMMGRRIKLAAILGVFLSCLVACDMSVVYFHYDHTQLSGWEKNDTLTFDVPKIARAGNYSTTIGLRVNGSFPFTSISLIVEQTIFPKMKVTTDTIDCPITDSKGQMLRQGVTYFQYEIPTTMVTALAPGDSIHYSIRHNMKRSILPGIADVGIKLTRNKK